MSRAMLMTVLARLDGIDTENGVPWYQKGIDWAVERGISDGSGPEQSITREQLVTMLHRYAGSPKAESDLSVFTDAAVSGYAAEAMRWAVSQEILVGFEDGTLQPKGTATRAQVSALVMRFCNCALF